MSDEYFDPVLGDIDPLNEHKGVGGGAGDNSYTSVGVDPNSLWDPTKGIDWSKVGSWAKNVFTGRGGFADYGTLLAGGLGIYEALTKDSTPKTWEGTIAKKPLAMPTPTADYWNAIQSRPYGSAAMGMDPFTFKGAPTVPGGITTPGITTPGVTTPGTTAPEEMRRGIASGYRPSARGAYAQMMSSTVRGGTDRYDNWVRGYKPQGGFTDRDVALLNLAEKQNSGLFTDLVGDPRYIGLKNPYQSAVDQSQIKYLRYQEQFGDDDPLTQSALNDFNAAKANFASASDQIRSQRDRSSDMQYIASRWGDIDFTNPNNVAGGLNNLAVSSFNYRRNPNEHSGFQLVQDAKAFGGAALAADFAAGRLTKEQADVLPRYLEAQRTLQREQAALAQEGQLPSWVPRQQGLSETRQRIIDTAQEQIDRYGAMLKGVDLPSLDYTKLSTPEGAADFANRAGVGLQAQHLFGGAKASYTPPKSASDTQSKPAVSNQEITDWLAQNKDASDADIRSAMDKYGVSIGQMAKATGLPEDQVKARYEAAGVKKAAEGGLMGLARGGALPPRYLRGQTDGMADKIPSNIDGVQPAKLSHGEFVVPADVVSHLGNGNSDAGAKVLYKMMDRVRVARTGNKKQGKQINPEKFTPGGIAGYAGGGAVAFQTGGTTVNPTGGGGTLSGGLSPYIGDYIADYLGKGWTLSEKPYQAYRGPLTAGTSPLQQQAFQGISGLQAPSSIGRAAQAATSITNQMQGLSYTPVGTSFTGAPNAPSSPGMGGPMYRPRPGEAGSSYDPEPSYGIDLPLGSGGPNPPDRVGGFKGPADLRQPIAPPPDKYSGQPTAQQPVGSIAQQYMNPYLQSALDPTLRELTRMSDIARTSDAARLAQAGAFGGSRQAIMESEGRRNLLGKQADVLSQGYASAYDRAMQQFNADQARKIQEAQFGSTYGLQALQGALGGAQTAGALGQQQLEAQKGILGAQLGAGMTQQGIEQSALDAQMKQFQEAQMYPYKQLQFQQSLIQGLPVSTSTTSPNTSMFADLTGGIGTLLNIYGKLKGVGG